MEVENNSSRKIVADDEDEDDDDVRLPGFRFHPTDEELVGFYLRRKIEKRPISLELIKQADIYKYDPWDLPSMPTEPSNGGDKEWYFFCKRGRKYKNSIRPNRVTASGFWKATGIDRPIYSSSGGEEKTSHCIGLKKSLVYYRGNAGKGTKTDWMMHEFRLPPKHLDAKAMDQEAEVWTLCRILKRSANHRKIIPDLKQATAAKRNGVIINPRVTDASSDTCSIESSVHQKVQRISNYISFSAPTTVDQVKKKPYSSNIQGFLNQQIHLGFSNSSSMVMGQDPSAGLSSYVPPSVYSAYGCADINEMLRHAEWEDLQVLADSATAAVPPAALYYPFNL